MDNTKQPLKEKNMLNLSKEEVKQKVGLVLEKRKMANPPKVAVKVFIDTSGSFRDEWEDGTVGLIAERVLAVANRFDDDGNLDIYHFNNEAHDCGSANFEKTNGVKYLKENILNKSSDELWNGTCFSPILNAVLPAKASSGGIFGSLFGKVKAEKKNQPTLVYIITDGDNADDHTTDTKFEESVDSNTYFMFVNVQSMAKNAKNYADKYPHVGYVFIKDLRKASDDQVIEALITEEYTNWRNNCK